MRGLSIICTAVAVFFLGHANQALSQPPSSGFNPAINSFLNPDALQAVAPSQDQSGSSQNNQVSDSQDLAQTKALGDGLVASGRGDYATARQIWLTLADKGNAEAMNDLGDMYKAGNGVAQNYAEAMKWYRKAADNGSVDAMNNLGDMYEGGQGVTRNEIEAMQWFREAADKGGVYEKWMFGLKCTGKGEYSEAAKWYRKVANYQGDDAPPGSIADAQTMLGDQYENGKGVLQDYAEAAKWYRKAAEQGDAEAQYHLGMMYKDGRGTPRDLIRAYMWLDLAASKRNEDRDENRDAVAKRMTSAQLAEAQKLAREWNPK